MTCASFFHDHAEADGLHRRARGFLGAAPAGGTGGCPWASLHHRALDQDRVGMHRRDPTARVREGRVVEFQRVQRACRCGAAARAGFIAIALSAALMAAGAWAGSSHSRRLPGAWPAARIISSALRDVAHFGLCQMVTVTWSPSFARRSLLRRPARQPGRGSPGALGTARSRRRRGSLRRPQRTSNMLP